jgi:DNA repair protein SbcD/Mre11
MAAFRFLHAADLHIDSPLRGLEADREAPAERIRTATRAAFTNLIDLAISEQVAFVLVAGDLIDGEWQDWRTGQFLLTEIGRLAKAGIKFYAIRGNHDAENPVLARLRLPDGAGIIFAADKPRTVRLPDLGVAIHGQSFREREVTENLALGYPPPHPGDLNIGLLHTAANGRDGHASYAPCTIEQLAAHNYDYWALGHVHAREELSREPWIVFAGNTQGRHIRETGSKGATLVSVREGDITAVEHRPLDVVRWALIDVDLPIDADEDAALGAVRAQLDAALSDAGGRLLAVRVILRGACAAHPALVRDLGATRDRLHNEALNLGGADAIWLEEVRVLTRPALDLPAMRARSDALGLLLREIDAMQPDALAPRLQAYCAAMLDRARGLRDALGEDHPAVAAARGEVPAELLARARDLLLARVAEG